MVAPDGVKVTRLWAMCEYCSNEEEKPKVNERLSQWTGKTGPQDPPVEEGREELINARTPGWGPI